MKKYQIWSEGYIVSGNSSGAIHLGSAMGETFREAVEAMLEEQRDSNDLHKFYRVREDGVLVIWGCRLFDNPNDASSKSFG